MSKKQESFEDIDISIRPEDISEEDRERLLSQDVRDEFDRISRGLEGFHGLFSQLWSMGYPHLSFQLPTAAVAFDKEGKYTEFLFNPILWEKLDEYTKSFIICHECLHVILNHGIRIKNCPLPDLANKALDIVVNHMLVNRFGFNRASLDFEPIADMFIDPETKKPIETKNDKGDDIFLCWIDTVFKDKADTIARNKPFEHYYNLLEENVKFIKGAPKFKDGSGAPGGMVIDDHDSLSSFNDEDVKGEIADKLNENLSEDEKKDLYKKIMKTEEGNQAEKSQGEAGDKKGNGDEEGGKEAGSIAGRIVYNPEARNVPIKRKWETVIRKWSRRYMKEEVSVEQWARISRRLFDVPHDLMIPCDFESEDLDAQKVDVFFFLDFSGSCMHLKDRFFRACESLPKDRFNVKLYTFDTEVHKVDPKNKNLRGGGGTKFSVIEQEIQSTIQREEIKRYPDAIFVMTDGYANHVNPECPEKWYFFLSDNYTYYIPEKSNKYMLSEFE